MSFEIKRWDVIISNDKQYPIIYIEPTIAFLEYVKNNQYVVSCKIHNTNTVYDNKDIVGIVNKSAYIPNCRPNFFNKYNYYVIVLYSATWNGYPEPENLGTVIINDM